MSGRSIVAVTEGGPAVKRFVATVSSVVTVILLCTSSPATAGPDEEPPACLAAAEDEAAAVNAAKACGDKVKIDGYTTESDEAFAKSDGTIQWRHHFRPVRAKVEGEWVPVDTDLETGEDGEVAPKVSAVDIKFSGGGRAPLATIRDDRETLSVDSPFGILPEPTLDGPVATYREVIPGVDLELRADVDGFSQLVVVKNAEAADDPRLDKINFPLNMQGLAVRRDRAGNIDLVGRDGKEKFSAAAPLMWDEPAHAAVRDDIPARGTGGQAGSGQEVTIPVQVSPDSLAITPDAAILDSKETTFPVYIDPTIQASRSAWTMVDSGSPNSSYWNSSGDAQIGTPNGGTNKRRSFFNINVGATPLAGKPVVSASLWLQESYSATCSPRQFDLYSAGGAVSGSTWNNQPTWATLQSSSTTTTGYSAACAGTTVSMDATPVVKAAASGSWTNVTLGLRSPNETDSTYFKRFNNNPYLDVRYSSAPVLTARSTDPSTACVVGASRPTVSDGSLGFRATFTSATTTVLTATFEWWNINGSSPVRSESATFKQGTETGTVVSPGDLVGGEVYKWRVKADDEALSSPWSSWCEFAFQNPTLSPDSTVGTDPEDGTQAALAGCVNAVDGLNGDYNFVCSPDGFVAVNEANPSDVYTDSVASAASETVVSATGYYPTPADYDGWCEATAMSKCTVISANRLEATSKAGLVYGYTDQTKPARIPLAQ